jgi:hypothetical protein
MLVKVEKGRGLAPTHGKKIYHMAIHAGNQLLSMIGTSIRSTLGHMGSMSVASPLDKALTSLMVRQFHSILGRRVVLGLGTRKHTEIGVVTQRNFG